jgi:hypothetical protein
LFAELKRLNIPLDSPVGEKLRKNRANVRKFVRRIRLNIIQSWELPETPTNQQENKKVKQTPETLNQQVMQAVSELGKRGSNNDDDDIDMLTDAINKNSLSESNGLQVIEGNSLGQKYLGQRSNNNKEFMDEYETPDSASKLIIDFMKNEMEIGENTKIWEPACGKNKKLATMIRTYGNYNDVLTTDINYGDKVDFLTAELPKGIQLIITNPPWSLNKKFINRAIEHGVPFIFFIKLEVQNTKYFAKVVKEYQTCGVMSQGRHMFLNPKTNKSIQMSGTFWFICGWSPYQGINSGAMPLIYYTYSPDNQNNTTDIEEIDEDEDALLWNEMNMLSYFNI